MPTSAMILQLVVEKYEVRKA